MLLQGSTQGHWRFPSRHLEEGHVYMLTHPSTPSIFLDHINDAKLQPVIARLVAIRRQADIHCRSKVGSFHPSRYLLSDVPHGLLLVLREHL